MSTRFTISGCISLNDSKKSIWMLSFYNTLKDARLIMSIQRLDVLSLPLSEVLLELPPTPDNTDMHKLGMI
jgi:hypothetical protein